MARDSGGPSKPLRDGVIFDSSVSQPAIKQENWHPVPWSPNLHVDCL